MTDVIVMARRAGTGPGPSLRRLADCLGPRLGPSGLQRREDYFETDREVQIAALACNPLTLRRGASLCTGALISADTHWWRPGAPAPEGSYALFRVAADAVECLTDSAGSRSIWYYADDEVFIAATCQRAIVALLGSFEANESAIGWMLAAGNTGPQGGWDRRLRLVPPDATVEFDRRSFRVRLRNATPPSLVTPPASPRPDSLFSELTQLMQGMDLDRERWALALSGGLDSRAILAALPGPGWQTVSWGARATLADPGSDLAIAQRLAERARTDHRFCALELAENPETSVDRFISFSEGRCENLGGYIDGFALWQRLSDSGVDGIIRGDELMGSRPTVTDAQCWHNMGLANFEDYASTEATRQLAAAWPLMRPDSLRRKPGESTVAWRQRLRSEHELPVVMAGLNHIRSRYVEMANPLLARRLVTATRRWTDECLNGRAFYKSMVASLYPDIPFARKPSVSTRSDIYSIVRMRELLMDTVGSAGYRELLPPVVHAEMMQWLADTGRPAQLLRGWANKLRRRLSLRERRFDLRGSVPVLDLRALALRTLIAGRTQQLFAEDVRCAASALIARPDTPRSANPRPAASIVY